MSRKVNFRDHVNSPFCGVYDDLAQLLLRVVASVESSRRVSAGTVRPEKLLALAPRPDFREERIFPYLDSPTLVIRQVPVELVHLVHRHHVDVPLQLIDAEEMPRAVKVHAPVGEPRPVPDNHVRPFPVRVPELVERLLRVEESSECACLDGNPALPDFNHIFLLPELRVIDFLDDSLIRLGASPEKLHVVRLRNHVHDVLSPVSAGRERQNRRDGRQFQCCKSHVFLKFFVNEDKDIK